MSDVIFRSLDDFKRFSSDRKKTEEDNLSLAKPFNFDEYLRYRKTGGLPKEPQEKIKLLEPEEFPFTTAEAVGTQTVIPELPLPSVVTISSPKPVSSDELLFNEIDRVVSEEEKRLVSPPEKAPIFKQSFIHPKSELDVKAEKYAYRKSYEIEDSRIYDTAVATSKLPVGVLDKVDVGKLKHGDVIIITNPKTKRSITIPLTEQKINALQVEQSGLGWQTIKNTIYKAGDILTYGASKRFVDRPVLTKLLRKHAEEIPYFKDSPTQKFARTLTGMGEASGYALSYMGPTKLFSLFKLPKIIQSAATFATVGGARRLLDPDEAKGMTFNKWMVGTGLDAMLGAAFPWLGRRGGEVLSEPKAIKALGKFLYQSGAISSGMEVNQFINAYSDALMDNPNKRALEVLSGTWNNFISHPEQIVKNFATMAFLHSTGVGSRFLKGGKLKAKEYRQLINNTNLLLKDMPEWARKAPKTIEEASRFMQMWTAKYEAIAVEKAPLVERLRQFRLKKLRQKEAQKLQAKAKARKEAVIVPETGIPEKPTPENILKMSIDQQITELQKLGYPDDVLVRFGGKERGYIIANQIKPTFEQRKGIIPERVEKPSEIVKPERRPEIPAKPEIKQPWEMTKEEYIRENFEPAISPTSSGRQKNRLGDYHKSFVKKALEEGKPVSAEVLKDYPDLIKAPKPDITKIAEALPVVLLKVSDVTMDPARFQPREKISQEMIDSIAERFDPAEWVEPTLWKDPKTGDLIVVSGHTRQIGIAKGGYGYATYKILPEGTTAEQARRYAETGNLARIEQTDFENAGVVRRRVDLGESITRIQQELPGLGSQVKVRNLLNLSYLDPKGMFREVYEKPTDFPKIVSLSQFVGSMRRKYPWITSTHEKDLFKFFYTEGGVARGDVTEAKLSIMDGLEKLDKTIGDKPTRLEWLYKGGLITGVEATHPELSRELKDKRRALNRIRLILAEEEVAIEVQKELKKEVSNLESEIAELERNLGIAGQTQEVLFSVQKQKTIFGGEEKAKPTISEAKRIRQEEALERKRQLERDRRFIEQRAKQGEITETTADILRKQVMAQKKLKLEKAGQRGIFGGVADQETLFAKAKKTEKKNISEQILKQAITRADDPYFREAKPSKESLTKKTISKRQIVDFVERTFSVPIRGKVTERKLRGKVRGLFAPGPILIRTKIAEDIYVISHEVAHYIDQKVWGRYLTADRPHFRQWELELGNLDYDSMRRSTGEGFAEFIRYYLSTGRAKEFAPNFYRYFTTDFARQNPQIFKKVERLRELVNIYNNQGSIARVKSQIDFLGKKPRGSIGERVQDAWENFRQAVTTDVAFLEGIFYKRAELKGRLRPEVDPIQIAYGVKGKANSKAQEWVMFNTTDWVGRVTGKGLAEILKPFSKNRKIIDDFLAYAYARRALSRPDINAGIELSDAEYVFQKFDSKTFRKGSDELSDFMDRALQYMVDAGALSPEARSMIKAANPLYLPLKRFFVNNITYRRMSGGKRIVDIGTPIKGIKGSGHAIINPLEAMTVYIQNMIAVADKTRLAKAIKNVASREGIGGLITKIDAPTKVTRFKVETILDAFERQGAEIDVKEIHDEILTIFSQGTRYTGKDNVVTIWDNGKPEFYEVHPKLFKTLKGIDNYTLPPLLDFFLGKPNRFVKLGAVGLNAVFSTIYNPGRDIPTYMIYSKSKVPNPAAPMLGIAADLGIGSKAALEAARRYRAMGGDMATIMGQDRATTRKILKEAIEKSKGMKGKTVYIAEHPIDAARRLFQIPEMGPRVAEMQRRIKYWEKKYGHDSDSAYLKAFNEAQDVTINFSRMGYATAMLNQMIPFFNPAIQGGAKLFRMAKERPVALVVKGVSTITIPMIYFWYMNKDEDWYKNQPGPVKYSHLYIDLSKLGGTDEVVVLPSPHELGTLFGGLPIAYLDEMYDIDPKGTEKAVKLFTQQLNPGGPSDIALIKPYLDAVSNRTWYGSPLESRGMQYKEVPDRYRDYTPQVAKALSRGIYKLFPESKWSPVKLQAVLNGYTGGIWGRVTNFIDLVNGKRIETRADIPVVGKLFLRKEAYEERGKIDWKKLNKLRLKSGSKTITPEERLELRRLEFQARRFSYQQKLKEEKNTLP